MLVSYMGVLVTGIMIWWLLKKAENAADERSDKTFFQVAKLACVVLVFLAEFFLQDVLPQAGKDAIEHEYGPPSYMPYDGDP
jgi:hypothetical protein